MRRKVGDWGGLGEGDIILDKLQNLQLEPESSTAQIEGERE